MESLDTSNHKNPGIATMNPPAHSGNEAYLSAGGKIKEIIEIVKRIGYKVLEVRIENCKVYFRLPDDISRREVEDVVAIISKQIPAKPFGVPRPWRRGFNINIKYLGG
jgi:hypothetical protein